MALLSVLYEGYSSFGPIISAVLPLLGLLVYYLYPYFFTYAALRSLPAPFPAQFTNWWLLRVCRRGNRYLVVDQLHKKMGPVVRIQPNHVSINDDSAINSIYGHGNGFLKSQSDYYDAFVSIRRGLFNTRDREQHTRKRKIVAHTFSPKSVVQFEPFIHHNLELFVRQWDRMISEGTGSNSVGLAKIDCLNWFNYLAFDVIGDLAFGAPFGMLENGADIAEVRASADSPPVYASAIEILNRRGEVSAAIGILPQLKPYAPWLPDPFFRNGTKSVSQLAGIAIARVRERLERQPPGKDLENGRKDLLGRLMEGRDENGAPLGREELTAEALTQLIAGSDTTSNSSCALLFHVVHTDNGRVLRKLQAELDAALPAGQDVPTFEDVRNLPYLQCVLDETLRLHSTSGIGLPRQVPFGSAGITLHGHYFPPGTVLSVPTYSIHHSTEIWGPDADLFRPERWAEVTPRQRSAFIPFSYGPRACVGRNIAEMEMKLIVSTWVRRYDVRLLQDHLDTCEGFLRKPLGLNVEIKRR